MLKQVKPLSRDTRTGPPNKTQQTQTFLVKKTPWRPPTRPLVSYGPLFASNCPPLRPCGADTDPPLSSSALIEQLQAIQILRRRKTKIIRPGGVMRKWMRCGPGFENTVVPPKAPSNIRIGVSTNRGPISTRDICGGPFGCRGSFSMIYSAIKNRMSGYV